MDKAMELYSRWVLKRQIPTTIIRWLNKLKGLQVLRKWNAVSSY